MHRTCTERISHIYFSTIITIEIYIGAHFLFTDGCSVGDMGLNKFGTNFLIKNRTSKIKLQVERHVKILPGQIGSRACFETCWMNVFMHLVECEFTPRSCCSVIGGEKYCETYALIYDFYIFNQIVLRFITMARWKVLTLFNCVFTERLETPAPISGQLT